MAIPAKNVLGNPNVTEGNFQIAIEQLRESVIGSGKAYDSANTYSQYDTCIYNGVTYYSKINSNTGNTPAVGANWGLESDLLGNDKLDKDFSILTSKTTPLDTDVFSLWDGAIKKVSWVNIKETLKTYLETLFIKKIVSPITSALVKINADGTLNNANIEQGTTGNILVGGAVDNGVDLLQINGSISNIASTNLYINLNTLPSFCIKTVVNSSCLNIPVSDWGFVEQFSDGGSFAYQTFVPLLSTRLFIRNKVAGSWGSWVEK